MGRPIETAGDTDLNVIPTRGTSVRIDAGSLLWRVRQLGQGKRDKQSTIIKTLSRVTTGRKDVVLLHLEGDIKGSRAQEINLRGNERRTGRADMTDKRASPLKEGGTGGEEGKWGYQGPDLKKKRGEQTGKRE